MTAKNLNLLTVFDAIYQHSSVSAAAKALRVTQPALSRSLAKLREDFSDRLFVRSKGGLAPTPKAIELAKSVTEVLSKIDGLYKPPKKFDPSLATGIVRIATTDYFEQVLWPDILKVLHQMAPNLILVTEMTGSHLPSNAMQEGSVQLAIAGFFDGMSSGFVKQTIFSDRFLSLTGTRNPDVRGRLSLASYLKLGHVIISPRGDLTTTVDKALQKKGLKRRIVASVTNFSSSGPIVANSNLVLTAPGKLIEKFSSYLPVNFHKPPLPLPPINVVQVWHERFAKDPLNVWLRQVIAKQCQLLHTI